jgi:hypothetical protein
MPNAVDTGAMNEAQQAATAGEAAGTSLHSLQGREYTFSNDQDRREGLDAAFDYRGDLTLRLRDGATIEGFVFNREPDAKPAMVQLFVKGEEQPRLLPYVDIAGVSFTGKDPADGKSYFAWKAKKHAERETESKQIEADLREKGYL